MRDDEEQEFEEEDKFEREMSESKCEFIPQEPRSVSSSAAGFDDSLQSLDHDTVEFELTFKESPETSPQNGASSSISPMEYTSTLQVADEVVTSPKSPSDIAESAETNPNDEIISKDSTIEIPEDPSANDEEGDTTPAVLIDNSDTAETQTGNDVVEADVEPSIGIVGEDSSTDSENIDNPAPVVDGSENSDNHLTTTKAPISEYLEEKRIQFEVATPSEDSTNSLDVTLSKAEKETSIDGQSFASKVVEGKINDSKDGNIRGVLNSTDSITPGENSSELMPLLVEETFSNFGTTEFLINKDIKNEDLEGATTNRPSDKKPSQTKSFASEIVVDDVVHTSNKSDNVNVGATKSNILLREIGSTAIVKEDTASVALSEDDWQSTMTSQTADGTATKGASDSDDEWMSCDSGASPRNLVGL